MRTRRLPAALLVAAAAASAAGCGSGGAPGPGVARPGFPEAATLLRTAEERAGHQVYAQEGCARCHALFDVPPEDGSLPEPGAPPPATGGSRVGPDLGLEGHRRSDDWHAAHLYVPSLLVPGTRMPAYRHLFETRDGAPALAPRGRALVAYLQALGRATRDVRAEWRARDVRVPAPPAPSLRLPERGGSLYLEHCAPCHGTAGDGRGEVAALLSPPPRDFTAADYRFRSAPYGGPPADADLFRAITLGGGAGSAMPSFAWLAPEDRWALVLRIKEFAPSLRGTGLTAERGEPVRQVAGGQGGSEAIVPDGPGAWAGLGCGGCHAAEGPGPPVDHACFLRGGASARAIERAVLYGVGAEMPAYAGAIDRRTLDILASWLAARAGAPPEPGEATSPGTPGPR